LSVENCPRSTLSLIIAEADGRDRLDWAFGIDVGLRCSWGGMVIALSLRSLGCMVAAAALVLTAGACTAPSETQPIDASLIAGEVVAVSDVAGEPESSVTNGWVLAVPDARVQELWEASDRPPPQPDELPYWNASIPRSVIDELAAALVALDRDGAFAVDVPPGSYLLCLLERIDPVVPFGCDEVMLTSGVHVRVTVGEGGVRLD
jgi:hypothetical protein